MGKVVDSFYLVPDGAKCRPVPIDNRADFPYGGWRYVAWGLSREGFMERI